MKVLRILLLLTITFQLTSCSKYDDNMGVSLQSKKNRLTQEWSADFYEVNAFEIPSNYYDMNVAFEDDGEYTYTFAYINGDGLLESQATIGEWSFNSDKTSILLEANNTVGSREWKIRRLQKDDLWVRIDVPENSSSIYVEFSAN